MYSGYSGRIIATPYTLSSCGCQSGQSVATLQGEQRYRDEIIVEVLQSKRGAARAVVKTTAEWEANPDYVPALGAILAYSDFEKKTDSQGIERDVPGLKIGDGVSKIGELMFVGTNEMAKVLTSEEVAEILGEPCPPGPGPEPPPFPGILTDEEILEILNHDPSDPPDGSDPIDPSGSGPSGTSENDLSGPSVAGTDRSDTLTDDEILTILNHGMEE